MLSASLDMGTMFFTQTGIGLMENLSLFGLYNFALLSRHNLRPTDLILIHLVSANCVVLFSKGFPQTMAAFGWRYFLDDTGCKLVFYFHQVTTGVSFSTICLINGFLVIKLNPSIWSWMELKIRPLKFIAFCCFLCWILHLMINLFVPTTVNGPLNGKNVSVKSNYGYCSWHMKEGFVDSLITVIYFPPDFMSLGFMVWASSPLVLVLRRHKQRVQHICRNRPSHEARATCTILILMSSFGTFYSASSILTIWMTLAVNRGQWRVSISVFVTLSFPTFFPFVLIISDTCVFQLCFACRARKSIS